MIDHELELAVGPRVGAAHEPLTAQIGLGEVAPDLVDRCGERPLEPDRVGCDLLDRGEFLR